MSRRIRIALGTFLIALPVGSFVTLVIVKGGWEGLMFVTCGISISVVAAACIVTGIELISKKP